jgi:hypothetical protein
MSLLPKKNAQRHIIVDDFEKKIFIQVMPNFRGELIITEWHDIKNGDWRKFLPEIILKACSDAANNGYTVLPFALTGAENDKVYLIQICGISVDGASPLWLPNYNG